MSLCAKTNKSLRVRRWCGQGSKEIKSPVLINSPVHTPRTTESPRGARPRYSVLRILFYHVCILTSPEKFTIISLQSYVLRVVDKLHTITKCTYCAVIYDYLPVCSKSRSSSIRRTCDYYTAAQQQAQLWQNVNGFNMSPRFRAFTPTPTPHSESSSTIQLD